MNVYIGSACGLVGQLGHCEKIYWGCVRIGGTAKTL